MNTAGETFAAVPMQTVGPMRIVSNELDGTVSTPLATYETPLWPSVARGAAVSMQTSGVHAVVVDERMTRSVLLEASDAQAAVTTARSLQENSGAFEAAAARTSRFARLIDWHYQIVGNLLFLRLEMTTGDAAGHNMVTAAADAVLEWLLGTYPSLRYVSVSGNFCSDKKATAVNGILGRGKYVVAEMTVAARICQRYLKTSPTKIVELNLKKNWIGTGLAGGVRSANAHFANMLLAFYVATGQDAANIVEGSQGFVHAEVRAGALYFSTTLPNLIVGTVGSGKNLPFVRENLERLGCLEKCPPGRNARRLAVIAAATVLCGELSLLGAQTNRGELMRSHFQLERGCSIA